MFNNKRLNKRITDLQIEMRELERGYRLLLDSRDSARKEIHKAFTDEVAVYRAAIQGTQTDKIKFGVLEEWIVEVFKLNNLKFSNEDFIQKSEEQLLRDKIAKDIEAWEIVDDSTNMHPEVFKFLKNQFASVARGEK
jgi:hypothetical protein